MTKSAVVFTGLTEARAAGMELADKIRDKLGAHIPSVVIVFASSFYKYNPLLKTLKDSCKTELLIGSSSAGEFTSEDFGTDSACAVAIYSNINVID